MSTKKISELTEAIASEITPGTDVIIINDGDTTKKIKVDEFLRAAGTAISGSLIPVVQGGLTSSFNLGSETAAWGEIYVATSSLNFVGSDGNISSWSKQDVTDLREGKSLNKTTNKQFRNLVDDTTFIRATAAGRAWHYASDKVLLKIQTASLDLGEATVPVTLIGTTIAITGSQSTTGSNDISGSVTNTGSCDISGSVTNTGSYDISGSTTNTGSYDISGSTTQTGSFGCSGSFAVNNLLDLLANYGSAGLPTGSGEGGVSVGDINLDGQVNVNDLLLLLAGYGNTNLLTTNLTIALNTNHQICGPTYSISQSITLTIPTSSVASITI
jgi:hypothetical protein